MDQNTLESKVLKLSKVRKSKVQLVNYLFLNQQNNKLKLMKLKNKSK